MRVFQPGLDLDGFFRDVAAAERRALLLDYDGTLAPFHVDRSERAPYPGVREVLTAILTARHTRLVVISGRWTRDVPPLLGIDPPPEIWGSHGWERLMPDGAYELAALDERAVRGLDEAYAWLEVSGLADRCERKPASVALHWRGLDAPAVAALRDCALERWRPLAERTSLVAHEFDGGIELRALGRDKGFAVTTVLAELGPGAAVAYLGDDTTDEDAFEAIAGSGLGVLVRAEPRPTAAGLWLQPPEELLKFLWRWHRVSARPR